MVSNFRQTVVWQLAKRTALDPVRRAAVKLAGRGQVPLMWCRGQNWGDALSPVLVSLLSGMRVQHLEGLHHDRYLAIGSILGGANEHAEVWGSGFICENDTTIGRPRAVHAVRGPLSRAALLKQGVDCPAVYGDPALLLPRFYNPAGSQRYAVGIIPHYIDKCHPWLDTVRNDPQVLVLDIESGITEFVQAVKSCEVIVSSSLHGLICADAYGIPNAWIRFSDDVIGGDFKFSDYRLSIGAEQPHALRITLDTTLAAAEALAGTHALRIDLRQLMLACPFLQPSLRKEVENTPPTSNGLPAAFASTRLEPGSDQP